ncbi:MAG: BamA/TamA family outer membrane protein [Candidatus Tectomicrobia bacterium]|uniref:BamA/TamA family outer membrane protein n=1 Tax=Tectimicrobiota bacterium TaxID=2528274 RepID=A0A932FXJ1_UNCTE|nr:BamA/TamA family outer membrane protein [Candidatus Tectomicrobia bacterium]
MAPRIVGAIIALGLLFSSPAQAKMSFVPMPVIDTDPNAGGTFGFMPVFMFLNEKEEVSSMMVPDLTYNEKTGISGTFRYFGYPKKGREYFLLLSQSIKRAHDYELHWEDSSFLDDRYRLELDLSSVVDTTARLYGFGNKSHEDRETNYAHQETAVKVMGGVNLFRNTRLELTESFRRVRVKEGEDDDLPYSRALFPRMRGLTRSRTWGHALALTYDSRDSVDLPTIGGYARMLWEVSFKDLISSSTFIRTTLDLKKLLPSRDKRFTLVLRGKGRFLLRQDQGLPFYEESRLGGWDTLRGFGDQRFIDHNLLLFSAEERIKVYSRRLFNVAAEFEVAPFLEAGRVFHHLSDMAGGRYHVVGGVGFRAIVRPDIVGFVDVGMGEEGTTAFMGLGYPF